MEFHMSKMWNSSCMDAADFASLSCFAKKMLYSFSKFNSAASDTVIAVSVLLSAFFVIIGIHAISIINFFAIIIILITTSMPYKKQNTDLYTK